MVTVVGVWTVVRMFEAANAREMILWLAAAWAAWSSVIAIKQWIWARLNTLAVLRALNRIETRLDRIEHR